MIRGGGDGRVYFPIANAARATIATTSKGRAEENVPSLCAQVSQSWPRNRARQPFRAIRSPHSTQKFAAAIAGVPARCAALYFMTRPRKQLIYSAAATKICGTGFKKL